MAGPGTIRGLRQLTTPAGRVCVVAADQRQSLRTMLGEAGVDSTEEMLGALKLEIARAVGDICPTLLIDPEYGLPALAANPSVAPGLPLMVSLEESGTVAWAGGRRSSQLAGWSAEAARAAGAGSVKLLIYLRADHPPTRDAALDLAARVSQECADADIPFILEILPFRLSDEDENTYKTALGSHLRENARIGAQLEPDLLKLPWPASPGDAESERQSLGTLANLPVPWALLSAGVPFEMFLEQAARALDQGGACGVIAGRALWGDALLADDVPAALRNGARNRLERLIQLLDGRGRRLTIPPLSFSESGD
jgi:sulfofructosephosphate aldolase